MSHDSFTGARRLAALIGAASLFATTGALAADVAKGKEKADQVCAACHGKDGNTPIDPSYPRLAGQHRDYLRQAMLDYQSDARKNPIMAAQAKQLSRADIDNLSAFYAGLPGTLSHKR
ncbi:MAG TPA: cytochrome c [Burkholderiaceae bacterium]|jgi:cytochrome c553|nr:cytochrome c [Burkholderiaceae bacterium]